MPVAVRSTRHVLTAWIMPPVIHPRRSCPNYLVAVVLSGGSEQRSPRPISSSTSDLGLLNFDALRDRKALTANEKRRCTQTTQMVRRGLRVVRGADTSVRDCWTIIESVRPEDPPVLVPWSAQTDHPPPFPCHGPRRRTIHYPFRVTVRAGGPSTTFQCRSRRTEWIASRRLFSDVPTARPVGRP
jgi:hypothetical protein